MSSFFLHSLHHLGNGAATCITKPAPIDPFTESELNKGCAESEQIDDVYDVCWDYLSPKGCNRNNCQWRHVDPQIDHNKIEDRKQRWMDRNRDRDRKKDRDTSRERDRSRDRSSRSHSIYDDRKKNENASIHNIPPPPPLFAMPPPPPFPYSPYAPPPPPPQAMQAYYVQYYAHYNAHFAMQRASYMAAKAAHEKEIEEYRKKEDEKEQEQIKKRIKKMKDSEMAKIKSLREESEEKAMLEKMEKKKKKGYRVKPGYQSDFEKAMNEMTESERKLVEKQKQNDCYLTNNQAKMTHKEQIDKFNKQLFDESHHKVMSWGLTYH